MAMPFMFKSKEHGNPEATAKETAKSVIHMSHGGGPIDGCQMCHGGKMAKGGEVKEGFFPEPESENDEHLDAEEGAKALIEAIHGRDPAAVAAAFRGLFDVHEAQPHMEEDDEGFAEGGEVEAPRNYEPSKAPSVNMGPKREAELPDLRLEKRRQGEGTESPRSAGNKYGSTGYEVKQ